MTTRMDRSMAGFGHALGQASVALPQEGVGFGGPHGHLAERGLEVPVAFAGCGFAGLVARLHGAR